VTYNFKSNFDLKVVHKFNSCLVQNRLCLHHEHRDVPDVVYERNVIFFLKITQDHTRIVGFKVSATRKQTVAVILGIQDISGCGDSQLTCFKTAVLTAGTGRFQKFRHTASSQLLRVHRSRKKSPAIRTPPPFPRYSPPACFSHVDLSYVLGQGRPTVLAKFPRQLLWAGSPATRVKSQ